MGWLRDKLGWLRGSSRPRRFLAVDFDGARMWIVQAEHQFGATRILHLAQADLPEKLDLGNARALGGFLGQKLKDLRIREAGVLMNVPRSQAVLRPITLPPGTGAGEMPGMVRFQVERQLPFAAQEAVIDFSLEAHYAAGGGERSPGVDVLAAAVRLPLVEHYRQVAASAGASLLHLGLRPYSTMCCVASGWADPQRPPCLAVVHLTADEAEISVLERDSLTFSRSVGCKIPRGGQGAGAEESVAAVVTEAVRSLQSYQYQDPQRGAGIEEVVVAGGTGVEPLVAETLGQRLGVRCRVLDPGALPDLGGAGREASSFVSVLGLARGYHRPEELPFDFLNPKRAPARRDPRKVRMVAAAAGAAVLLLAGVVSGSAYLIGKNSHVKGLEAQYRDLAAKTRPFNDVRSRYNAVEEWTGARCDWLGHLARLSGLFPPNTEAYLDGVGGDAAKKKLTFVVHGRNAATLEELTTRLKAAGYEVVPGQVTTASDPVYRFSVKVDLVAKEARPELTTQPMPLPPSAAPSYAPTRSPSSAPSETPSNPSGDRPSRPPFVAPSGTPSRTPSGTPTTSPYGSSRRRHSS